MVGKCRIAYCSQWIEWSASWCSFLSSQELLLPLCDVADWGQVYSCTPLYTLLIHYINGVIDTAHCHKEVNVAKYMHKQGLTFWFFKFFCRTNSFDIIHDPSSLLDSAPAESNSSAAKWLYSASDSLNSKAWAGYLAAWMRNSGAWVAILVFFKGSQAWDIRAGVFT
jgi:hypothetical protein